MGAFALFDESVFLLVVISLNIAFISAASVTLLFPFGVLSEVEPWQDSSETDFTDMGRLSVAGRVGAVGAAI